MTAAVLWFLAVAVAALAAWIGAVPLLALVILTAAVLMPPKKG